MKRNISIGAALAVLALVALVAWFRPILDWTQGAFGFRPNDGNSESYLFWSGFGSDLAYVGIIASAVVYYRQQNCKKRWCPFLGHYEFRNPETGIVRKLCWVHHPDVHDKNLSRDRIGKIKELQAEHPLFYLGDKPGKG